VISLTREADRCGLSDAEFRGRLQEIGVGAAGNGQAWEAAVRSLADRIAKERREGRNADH
jgi:hypothetical protein